MADMKSSITIEYLNHNLSIDRELGHLIWKTGRRRGLRAGCPSTRGYWVMGVNKRLTGVHRVMWMLANQELIPDGMEIDHINGNPSDNRPANLRLAQRWQNKANSDSERGVSGIRGVTWSKRKQRWHAQISHKNKCVFLGYFDRLEDAAAARKTAEEKIHGDFSFANSRGI